MKKVLIGMVSVFLFLSVSFGSVISNVKITSITDRRFVVSWWSASSEAGSVSYGTSGSLGSSSGEIRVTQNQIIHYIPVGWPDGLAPNTLYYFDIHSGSTVDNNGGAHYSVRTGPSLFPGSTDPRYGYTFSDSGGIWSQLNNVYYEMWLEDKNDLGTLGKSQVLSGLSNVTYTDGSSDPGWFAGLENFRSPDLQTAFSYSGSDHLVLNFYYENGNKTQLRMPLNVTTQSVALIKEIYPT